MLETSIKNNICSINQTMNKSVESIQADIEKMDKQISKLIEIYEILCETLELKKKLEMAKLEGIQIDSMISSAQNESMKNNNIKSQQKLEIIIMLNYIKYAGFGIKCVYPFLEESDIATIDSFISFVQTENFDPVEVLAGFDLVLDSIRSKSIYCFSMNKSEVDRIFSMNKPVTETITSSNSSIEIHH